MKKWGNGGTAQKEACRAQSWCGLLLEKLVLPHLVKKFPAVYGTRRVITVFIAFRHVSLFRATSIQSAASLSYILYIHFNIVMLLRRGGSPFQFVTF